MTVHQDGAFRGKNGTHPRKRNNTTKKRGIGRVVDRGTETVERLHRAVAGLPLDALQGIRRLEKPIARVRKLQEKSISATYALVRGVNHEVVQLARGASPKRRAQRPRGKARGSGRPKLKKVTRPEAVARTG